MNQEVKGSVAEILNVCADFNEKIFPEDNTGRMLSDEVIADFCRYFVFLTLADGVLTGEEVGFINNCFDTDYTIDDMQEFAQEERTDDASSMMSVPLSLNYFIRIDNLFYTEQEIVTNYTESLIELYKKAGMEFICCDGDLSMEEMNIYNQFIAMLEDYAKLNLEKNED